MYFKMPKRMLSFLLALVLLVSTFASTAAVSVSAAEVDAAATGELATLSHNYLGGKVSVVAQHELDNIPFETGFSGEADDSSFTVMAVPFDYNMLEGQNTVASIVITNNSAYPVEYNVTVDYCEGSVSYSTVGGSDFTDLEADTYEYELEAGASIQFNVQSNYDSLFGNYDMDEVFASIVIEEFAEKIPSTGEARVYKNAHATITANNGYEASVDGSNTGLDYFDVNYNENFDFTLTATPATGYEFFAWVDASGAIVSTSNPYVSSPSGSTNSFAAVVYKTGTNYSVSVPYNTSKITATCDTLDDALILGNGINGRVITVKKDSTLTGSYTIPSGTTLLVPCDDAGTIYHATSGILTKSYTTPSKKVLLTMAENASLTIAGGAELNVASKLAASGQFDGNVGMPTGANGRIKMASGSTITVQNGGNLYAWGYIYRNSATSEGSVIAESGATVYEAMQVKNFRGGTITGQIVGSQMPFNQYYVQNIEVPLTIYAGASEIGYSGVTVGSWITMTYPMTLPFIGADSLFTMENGYLVKDYIEATDRLDIRIYGDASMNPVKLSVNSTGLNTDTSNYPLPLTNNITVEVKSGNTVVNQDITILPGTELIIDNGAGVEIAEDAEINVFARDEYIGQGYAGAISKVGNVDLIPLKYVACNNGAPTKRTSADLADGKVDINGTVEVKGGFYATSNSNITSSENTGKIEYATVAETSLTRKEYSGSTGGHQNDVTFTAAQIKAPDGTYVSATKIVDDGNGGTKVVFITAELEYTPEVTGDDPAPAALTKTTEYLVIWKSFDGNKSYYQAAYLPGETPEYGGGVTPTMTDTNTYHYDDFTGWTATQGNQDPDADLSGLTPTFPAITDHDTTYYAAHTRTRKYKAEWKNENTTIQTIYAIPGTTLDYTGTAAPSKDTNQYHYEFLGWTDNNSVTYAPGYDFSQLTMGEADITFTATYGDAQEKSYTVVWKDYDGTVIEDAGSKTYTEIQALTSPSSGNPTRDASYEGNFHANSIAYKVTEEGNPARNNQAKRTTYTFNKWSKSYSGDTCTMTASYNSAAKYLVIWLSDNTADAHVLYYDYYPCISGNINATDADAHIDIPENAQYTYKYIWNKTSGNALFIDWYYYESNANNDCTFYATGIQAIPKTFTVTWKNGDTVLETDTEVSYNATPSYDSAIPGETGDYLTGWEYSYVPFGETDPVTGYVRTDKTGALIEGDTYPAVVSDITFTAVLKQKYTAESDVFNKHSLSANGQVGVNFYLDVDAYVADGMELDKMYVTYSWGEDPDNSGDPFTATGDVVFHNGKYRSTLNVAPKEMNDEITVNLYGDDDALISTHTYTASDYLYDVIRNDTGNYAQILGLTAEKFAQLQELCKAMLHYGAKAQMQFGYHTGLPADSAIEYSDPFSFDADSVRSALSDQNIANDDFSLDSTSAYAAVTSMGLPGAYYGQALTLESNTVYNLVFYNVSGMPLTATATSGSKTYQVKRVVHDGVQGSANSDGIGDYVSYDIVDIPAAKLLEDITLTIGDYDAVTVNPGTYMALALKTVDYYRNHGYGGVAVDNLENVIAALYQYNTAAVTYFG